MKVTIIGIKKAKTKNGKDFCQYYFQKAFTGYEVENSLMGLNLWYPKSKNLAKDSYF